MFLELIERGSKNVYKVFVEEKYDCNPEEREITFEEGKKFEDRYGIQMQKYHQCYRNDHVFKL